MRIAIDGPAGAGKSTIAKILASQLGYTYIDSGAMYRALTYLALERQIDPADEEGLKSLLINFDMKFQPDPVRGGNRVILHGWDITNEIRRPEVNENVSAVASHPQIRAAMVSLQQEMAAADNVVMDGRDIGTTVMPDADLKVFLQASPAERARRRSLELIRQGYQVDLAELEEQIRRRDLIDSTRQVSPLRKAEDAVEIDTTNLSVHEVVEIILSLCRRKELHV